VSDIETLIDRLTDRQRQEFALACARRIQHLMIDPRSVAALDTRERWLRGEATGEEMDAAWRAATIAGWHAEKDEARDAARAAWAAASNAASDEELAAELAAEWAAERAWQCAELERMLGEVQP